MTTTTIYRNNRNENKYLEVHDDGHSHWAVRQFMEWTYRKNGVLISRTRNMTGDGILHRWRRDNLSELLSDYSPV